jgi:septal ring factor EnvC (AmiA/AmiB activator)
MEKMMKIIKKYWALIVGTILGIFGIVFAAKKKQTDKQVDQIDQKIDDNNQQIDIITGNVAAIEDQREDVKQDIKQQEEEIKSTEEAKETIQPETPNTVADAKENILNKTKKRGRKKKS